MSETITIIPLEDHRQYNINGNTVYLDNNGNWVSNSPLGEKEAKAFKRYKSNVIDNPRFKKHTKATYKG